MHDYINIEINIGLYCEGSNCIGHIICNIIGLRNISQVEHEYFVMLP